MSTRGTLTFRVVGNLPLATIADWRKTWIRDLFPQTDEDS